MSSLMTSKLTLRYMQQQDIAQVVAIDQEAFPIPWSARSYAYEVSESTYSYMLVLEQAEEHPVNGWRRLIRNFNGAVEATVLQKTVIGYGGLWNISDEAHISTIATHNQWRGQGYGEILLAAMIQRSINLGSAYIVLEVRVGNVRAQQLYKKYEFEAVAVKSKYYHDNGEDAYDMRLDLEDPQILARFRDRMWALRQRFEFEDHFSETPRPARR